MVGTFTRPFRPAVALRLTLLICARLQAGVASGSADEPDGARGNGLATAQQSPSCTSALTEMCSGTVRSQCSVCRGIDGHGVPVVLPASCSAAKIASFCAAVEDSLLQNQFCQVYYDGADPSACPALRSQVVAKHARALPTLELGDSSLPPMLSIL